MRCTLTEEITAMRDCGIEGTICRGLGGLYGVYCPGREEMLLCRARGHFRRDGITPLVGDHVTILPAREIDESETDTDPATRAQRKKEAEALWVIDAIRERKNALIRPPLSNLTHLFLLLPSASPLPDLCMADKLTAIAVHGGITPIIVTSKTDMDPAMAARIAHIYETAGFPVFPLSAVSGDGVDALESYLAAIAAEGEVTAAFAGVSAAGKSTLMTRLYPHLALKTNTVSRKIQRGRHTTRHVELYPVTSGGARYFLADTPGFSVIDFTRFDFFPVEELPDTFPEFADCLGNCRYTKCTHTKEEGCAVLAKMAEGKIAPERHESYCSIRREILEKPEWQRQKESEHRGKR